MGRSLQRPGEAIGDFADRLLVAGRTEFASTPEEEVEEMLVNTFLEGLLDRKLAMEVAKFDPKSLGDSVERCRIVDGAMNSAVLGYGRRDLDQEEEGAVRKLASNQLGAGEGEKGTERLESANMMSVLEKILAKLEEGPAQGPAVDRNRTNGGAIVVE